MKLIIILLLAAQTLFAHEVIQSFKVNVNNENIKQIADKFEVKSRNGNELVIYVVEESLDKFRALAPNAVLLNSDLNSHLKSKSLTGYHKFDEVESIYKQYAREFPNISTFETYGKSKKGRDLFVLRVSGNTRMSKPKLLITSATHGDELITVEVQLRLVRELLAGYSSDERLKKIIDNVEIFFIPVVNPDGFSRRSRYSSGRVDPNRDYPWPDKPNRKSKVKAIQQLLDLFHRHEFKGSMDIHASGKMVMFPWGYTRNNISTADFNFMNELTRSMSKENKYKYGPISKVIYVAKGSSADYYYWKKGTVALAIELTTSKAPTSSQIPIVVDEAREMMWKFLEAF